MIDEVNKILKKEFGLDISVELKEGKLYVEGIDTTISISTNDIELSPILKQEIENLKINAVIDSVIKYINKDIKLDVK